MRMFSGNIIPSYRGGIEGYEGMGEVGEICGYPRRAHDALFYALYISSPYR